MSPGTVAGNASCRKDATLPRESGNNVGGAEKADEADEEDEEDEVVCDVTLLKPPPALSNPAKGMTETCPDLTNPEVASEVVEVVRCVSLGSCTAFAPERGAYRAAGPGGEGVAPGKRARTSLSSSSAAAATAAVAARDSARSLRRDIDVEGDDTFTVALDDVDVDDAAAAAGCCGSDAREEPEDAECVTWVERASGVARYAASTFSNASASGDAEEDDVVDDDDDDDDATLRFGGVNMSVPLPAGNVSTASGVTFAAAGSAPGRGAAFWKPPRRGSMAKGEVAGASASADGLATTTGICSGVTGEMAMSFILSR